MLLSAYVVVLVTLAGQDPAFEPLLRRLGLRANEAEEVHVRQGARLAAVGAGIAEVDDMQAGGAVPATLADAMRSSLRQRSARLRARMSLLAESDSDDGWPPEFERAVRAQRALIRAQRDELVRWRDSGRLTDESLRQLQRELDYEERTLPGASARPVSSVTLSTGGWGS